MGSKSPADMGLATSPAEKALAQGRMDKEQDRTAKELQDWLDFCDETETTGPLYVIRVDR